MVNNGQSLEEKTRNRIKIGRYQLFFLMKNKNEGSSRPMFHFPLPPNPRLIHDSEVGKVVHESRGERTDWFLLEKPVLTAKRKIKKRLKKA